MKTLAPLFALFLTATAPLGLFACDMLGKRAVPDAAVAAPETATPVATVPVVVTPTATAVQPLQPGQPGHAGGRPVARADGGAATVGEGGVVAVAVPGAPGAFVIPSSFAIPSSIVIPSAIVIPSSFAIPTAIPSAGH
jgi:hypothetical protein